MYKWLLAALLFFSFVVRVYNISNIPAGFTPDEASYGYDAYSILKTGRDQWGRAFPIVLESHGDFKMPVYSYLALPSVFLFGLNVFSTRIINALLSTVAVYISYLLVLEILPQSERKKREISLLAAFLLSVSAWHIPLSRGAFEANLTTFFMPLALLLFFRSFKNHKLLYYSSFIFGINLFTYHSSRATTLVLVLLVVGFFFKKLKLFPARVLFYSSIIFAVFLLGTIYSYKLGAGARASDISVMSGAAEAAAAPRLQAIESGVNPFVAKVMFNKYRVGLNRFIDNYTQYISPRFLFTSGPAEATYGMIPGKGVLYWGELILLISFLLLLLKNYSNRVYLFLISWFLVSIIPPALSMGVGYAGNRAAGMMPVVYIMMAIGIIFIRYNYRFIVTAIVCMISIEAIMFLSNYFDYYGAAQQKIAGSMLYGNVEMLKTLSINEQVVISTGISEPQIYVAFVHKIDPVVYQNAIQNWDYKKHNVRFLDQLSNYSLQNFSFRRIDWKRDHLTSDIFIGRPSEFSTEVDLLQAIPLPIGGDPVIVKLRAK